MPSEHSAGAIIYNKGRYLLLHRKAHEHYKEGWFFVRGKIEQGETTEVTVRREVSEETGIKDLFFVKGFFETSEWFYRKEGQTVHKQADYLFAETSTENVTLSPEHESYAWLPFGEAYAKLKFEADKQILKKANDFIEKAKRE